MAHPAASPGGRGAPGRTRRSAPHWCRGLRVHHLLFIAFTVVSAVPITVLALWEERSSYQHELQSVRERYLLVARNLAVTISRNVRDLKAAFTVVFESGGLDSPVPGLPTC